MAVLLGERHPARPCCPSLRLISGCSTPPLRACKLSVTLPASRSIGLCGSGDYQLAAMGEAGVTIVESPKSAMRTGCSTSMQERRRVTLVNYIFS
ncbi:hypothetical protein RGR602_PC02227 (plasmid) [Rhizobium gallicum bv. gallicum R602sp]|uniref:Uncharacterized protein n=1 Tax=Rhizobium gallicum bv. gallicum R602sp TaxID=1041138 RepID=A0A0B4XGP0_9HYPH|nr:hypothetical protein RGR602_PC02227 [Rhizobium gallicum bv. gallicum R602sp]